MPARKAFLLRIDPALLDAVQRWADDDLRSLNGQIEFLLRKALQDARRARLREASRETGPSESDDNRGGRPKMASSEDDSGAAE